MGEWRESVKAGVCETDGLSDLDFNFYLSPKAIFNNFKQGFEIDV
jgi:hypothetical protein